MAFGEKILFHRLVGVPVGRWRIGSEYTPSVLKLNERRAKTLKENVVSIFHYISSEYLWYLSVGKLFPKHPICGRLFVSFPLELIPTYLP